MTIELGLLLLSACVVALVLGFGLWFKHVLGRQLGLKDSVIEALKMEVEGQKAKILHLQGEMVPIIAQYYETLRKYAEDASVERNRFAGELNALAVKLQSKERGAPEWTLLGEANGLLVAAGLATKALKELRDFISNDQPSPDPLAQRMSFLLIGSLMDMRKGIATEIEGRRSKLRGLFPEQAGKTVVN